MGHPCYQKMHIRSKINTTTVKNVGGADCVGKNPTDRGRLGTKISILLDERKIAVSEPTIFPANVHDCKTLFTLNISLES